MFGASSELVFEMQTNRPTQRSAKALAELVGKGVITVECKINGWGGVRYRALKDSEPPLAWYMKLPEDEKKRHS